MTDETNDSLGSLDSLDEQALSRLLHGAVDDLEPSPDALEHLRRAVPARRTRRRQAVVGAAAAVILGATALPALIHVATTAGTADDHAANAASSRQRTHELTGGQHGADGDESEPERSHGSALPEERKKDEEKKREEERKKDDGSATGPAGSIAGTAPATGGPTLIAASPTCDRNQLGKGTSTVGSADKDGKIYGAFRVVNVSGTVCSVAGSGAVAAHAQGSADSTRVTVVDHTSGDAAPALPDPSVQPSQVILQPGQAYEIKFAWVPAADGGPNGCARPTAPTASPQSTTTATPGATKTEEKVQPQDPDQSKPPATVVLSHTPDVGEPKAADATCLLYTSDAADE
ncbi:hypothetical protein RM609_30780 [Streptomyces sp. DSM 40473]|uniref:DUF4232 domain-containing protein n=1 Tax=Streptomyces hesseae TaxID=3075519 RepID=A0ABU2SWQ9_9ACTN|nr:hypothetical protein [Streptomyces sp. DSM 40473]MDT0453437.1 hypothetical protein [Streptomyces sp. DSM 40473]